MKGLQDVRTLRSMAAPLPTRDNQVVSSATGGFDGTDYIYGNAPCTCFDGGS